MVRPRATRTVVGMEACPGSQWLARKLQAMGCGDSDAQKNTLGATSHGTDQSMPIFATKLVDESRVDMDREAIAGAWR